MSAAANRRPAEYPPPPSPPQAKLYSQRSPRGSAEPLNQTFDGSTPSSAEPLNQTYDVASSPSRPSTAHRPHRSTMHETENELTEDERIEYEKGVLNWSAMKSWRYWIRREWLWWYIIGVFIIVIVALMAFFHHDIVDWLTPFTKRMQSVKAGFIIPVSIIFVLSFPPLFGNEIVLVLVGIVWGLGKGFAIATVGTVLGEVANYVLFKYWCRGRAERMTKKSLNYACLSQVLEEGGWFMATIVRLSVLPTHVSTAVLAVCGLAFYHFFIALILSLPKQLLAVYVGVVLAKNSGTGSHVVSDCVFAATAVISIGAVWFIYKRMLAVRKKVIIGMRDDLRSKNIATTDPATSSEYATADADERSWRNPFAKTAVTAPKR